MAKCKFKLVNKPKPKICKHCYKQIENCETDCEECLGFRFMVSSFSLE